MDQARDIAKEPCRGLEFAEQGQSFRAMATFEVQLKLPKLGAYRVVAEAAEAGQRTLTFYAVPPPTTGREA